MKSAYKRADSSVSVMLSCLGTLMSIRLVALLSILLGMACGAIAGCGDTSAKAVRTSSSPQKEADPVALLKEVFADGKKRAEAGIWSLTRSNLDVKKTDSLVSPYSGVITFQSSYTSTSTKEDVRHHIKLEYTFQEGRWVQTSAEFKAETPGAVWNDMRHQLAGRNLRELAEIFRR